MPSPSPLTDFTDPRAATSAIQAELNRRRWLADPVAWVAERLGEDLWSKQQEILYSVRDNRLTAVRSCHASGKSFLASRLACWWIDCHPPGTAFVVTTATTWKQVEVVLWRELRRAHAKGGLRGRTNRTEWLMPIVGAGADTEEQVAFGHRPADNDPTAFHGIHAPFVLVIFDEACGIPKLIWEAADSLISNEDSRFLAIGNPDDPITEFAEVSKPGSGWNAIRISARDTPNFSNEVIPDAVKKQLISKVWVAEKKLRWGENNPLYISKVEGEFPEFSEDGLIPASWVRAAQLRWPGLKSHPVEFGVDVGAGGDKNVIVCRWGTVAQVVLDDRQPDTMKTAGNVKRLIAQYQPERVKVDYIGIGRGAVDRLKEQKLTSVEGIQVGTPAGDHGYRNLRAEGYWHLRELFRPDKPIDEPLIAIDPTDEDLAAQLLDLRYEPTSDGKIQIESKEAMKRRGRRSPDRADALMLAFLPQPKRRKGATWGKRRGGGMGQSQSQPASPPPTTYTRR